jgi:large subunit ribosomal protein L27
MAHKKGEGSTQNGRDSNSKRLGVKLYGGQTAKAGNIIIRQRGTKFHPGQNTYLGKDFTLHASILGKIVYTKGRGGKTFVHVLPFDAPVAETVAPAAVAKAAKKTTAPAAKAAAATPAAAPKAKAAAAVETVAAAPAVEATPAPAAVVEEVAVSSAEMAAPSVSFDEPTMDFDAAFDEPAAEEVAAPAAKASKKVSGADDLKKIEGIGPKIADLLIEGGIVTFADLAAAPVERVQEILDAAGSRYRVHNPATWGQQAQMAADGKWDELKAWQDELNGGKPE